MMLRKVVLTDGLVRAGEVAAVLGVTRTRLQQLAREGFIPKSVGGRYPLFATVQGYRAYYRHKLGENARDRKAAELELMEARTSLIEARSWEHEEKARAHRRANVRRHLGSIG